MTPPPVYIDSSVALHLLIESHATPGALRWFAAERARLVSSRLLMTEMVRALRRDGQPPAAAAAVVASIGLIDVTALVHAHAESIPAHVKPLDALHLGTAMLLGRDTLMASHDRQMLQAAQQLGLPTIDPVAEAVGD